jgi:uncharacterized membrane protein (UPF0127 family)
MGLRRRRQAALAFGLAASGVALATALSRAQARGAGGPPQTLPVTARWCLEPAPAGPTPRCIALEVADTPQRQAWGLQMRPRLPALRGMWFPYAMPSPLRFWMHRTPESLDIIFLRQGRVIAIAAAIPCMRLPCPTYGPDEPADGVVELAAGEAQRLGIRVGSRATIVRIPPT